MQLKELKRIVAEAERKGLTDESSVFIRVVDDVGAEDCACVPEDTYEYPLVFLQPPNYNWGNGYIRFTVQLDSLVLEKGQF